MQAAMMAPTETLAEQHFRTIQSLLPHELMAIGLLTGSTPARRREDLLSKLETREMSLVVGTHALFQEDVAFRDLALAVIDEQHRFGVHQRMGLTGKGADGRVGLDALVMTATPIPRTLMLCAYGDMDVSKLTRKPDDDIKSQEKWRPKPEWRQFQRRWARPAIIHAREAA